MATVHVVLGRLARDASRVEIIPLSVPVGVDTVTSSGTSAQASLTAAAADRQFWSVATDGAIYVAFGSNPTAAADSGWYIPAGSTREFAVSATGEKIAIKDA